MTNDPTMRTDFSRDGVDPWWEYNPDHWCQTCNTRIRDSHGDIRPCPFGCEATT